MSNSRIPPDMVAAAKQELARRQAAREEMQRRGSENSLMGQAEKIPGYVAGEALSLPGKIWDTVKAAPGAAGKMLAHPIDAGRDILGGALRGGQNLGNAIGQAVENPTHALYEKLTGKKVPHFDTREMFGLGDKNPVDLGNMVGSQNPNALLQGLGQYGLGGAMGGAKALPFIGANAVNSAIQAPEGQRLQGGVAGLVDSALPIGAGKTVNAMRPSKMLEGTLSSKQLQSNLEAARGTNTNIGDVVGSPFLKRLYENILPRVPGAGAAQRMQETAGQIVNKGEEHIGNLGKNLPAGDKAQYLQDAIRKAAKDATQEKTANFEKANDIADNAGVVVGRNKFQQKANDILDEINKSPELAREFDPDLKADLLQYARNPAGNTLKLSNIFKGKLNDKATDFYLNGKKYEYGKTRELRDALSEDIDEAITDPKNPPELKAAHDKAMENYRTKFAPFEDPDVAKFVRDGGDADVMLSHFLRTGANDRGTLLSKVTSKLPQKAKNLPAYMYLTRAIEDGQLNPLKMRTLYKNLGEKQKKALIPDVNMREAINKYTKSVGMNTEAFQTMFNPHTGQRVSDMIPMAGAMAGYSMLGGGVPGLVGGAIGATVPGLVGKGITKTITNPTVREKVVQAIIKNKIKRGL